MPTENLEEFAAKLAKYNLSLGQYGDSLQAASVSSSR